MKDAPSRLPAHAMPPMPARPCAPAMRPRLPAIGAVLAFLLLLGCVQPNYDKAAIASCRQACQQALDSGRDLSAGPCLQNPMPGNPAWVCDVAHIPRQAVDDSPSNQCPAYGHGNVTHFVEVRPNCELIRTH